ncbi:MAG: ATP-binding cassette domain-containing protein [Thermoflexales bacterium]|nr:ATP-binding cassette domain-containing protein [Thermoflexales bacterium]
MRLNAHNLAKYFGPVAALADCSFDIGPGEILGVVGQRGSGKTTLFQLLSGAQAPTSGTIQIDGRLTALKSPAHAQRLGIEISHQQPQLAGNLSVLQNIFLGREASRIKRLGMLPDEMAMVSQARELLAAFDMPATLLGERAQALSGEQRHVVGLARALCRPLKLLLLDNALEALSYDRQRSLLDQVRALAAKGAAVVIGSDDLKQVFEVTQRILVLHPGRTATLRITSECTPREIVELIVGANRQDQITPVIWAIENYHIAQRQAEQLRETKRELEQSLEARDSQNRELIARMRVQLDALDRLNVALQDAHHRLMTEREAERKRLARELHDQVIQDLLSFAYQLEEVEDEAIDEAQRAELLKIRSGLRQAVSNVRDMCSDLRPPTIDRHGLPSAIRSLAQQWSAANNIEVKLDIDPELGRLPEAIELSVYRIVQEGLSNVRKHARATQVRIVLSRTPTASLTMRLIDNGQGLPGKLDLASLSQRKSFGLVGIGERVSLLRGTMDISRSEGGGLDMTIEIPSPYPSITN